MQRGDRITGYATGFTRLDGQMAGFVHSSSMSAIAGFDTRGLKSRQLIVLHRLDACKVTSPSAGAANRSKFGDRKSTRLNSSH